MKRAILTGVMGPLGVALADYLAQNQIQQTLILHPGSKHNANFPVLAGAQVVECDLADLGSLSERLSDQYDVFFHLAWNTATREVTNDPCVQAQNILFTLNAVQLAHKLGCKVFVGAGSQAEFGRAEQLLMPDTPAQPETSYGISKYAAGMLGRKLCELYGIRHNWARILSIYGPHDRETTAIMYCISTLLKGKKPSFTKAEQMWDYIYSADCAKAMYLIAEKGRHGLFYTVGSGHARPLREYFEFIRDLIDPALLLGLGELEYVAGQRMYLCSDNSELYKDTGFTAEYSFEAGIRKTIDWFKTKALGAS